MTAGLHLDCPIATQRHGGNTMGNHGMLKFVSLINYEA